MKRATALTLLAGMVLLSCSTSPVQVSGGSTSTPNERISGSVVYPHGEPMANAVVTLRRSNYVAIPESSGLARRQLDLVNTQTDSKGRFYIDSVDSGTYRIEINDRRGHAVVVPVTMDTMGRPVKIPVDTARPVGAVTGFVDCTMQEQNPVWLQIVGLERLVRIDRTLGRFTIADLPAGTYDLRFMTPSIPGPVAELKNVIVTSGATSTTDSVVPQPYLAWAHHARIVLNTTATGADVQGTVTGFVLLVRLRSAAFDFATTRPDGLDLRFTRSDHTPLAFEIERFDPQAGLAEIWVGVDTVHGANDSQYIELYWGNPLAARPADFGPVFRTEAGYQGVWHLNGSGDAPAVDVTTNRFDGTPLGMPVSAGADGIIGGCRVFGADTGYIRMFNTASSALQFEQNGVYTVSAWVSSDAIDTLPHVIASKGHESYYLKMMTSPDLGNVWEFVEFQDRLGWEISEESQPATPGTWHHLVGVRDGNRQLLFRNGVCIDSTTRIIEGDTARVDTDDFSLGRYIRPVEYVGLEGFAAFHGRIDEVRVLSHAPDAAWIRLNYMNQRSDDRLMTIIRSR